MKEKPMGLFQRMAGKPEFADEYDEYEDGYEEYTENEAYGAEVSPMRSVTSVPQLVRLVTVHPTSFEEVRSFAEQYRMGVPVILDLTDAADETRKRIVDFALGLCFGLEGNLNKVSEDVLLMTPHTVAVDEQLSGAGSAF